MDSTAMVKTYRVGSFPVGQRVTDGYVNATVLCRAASKHVGDYIRLDSTSAFLSELSDTMGIPIVSLVESREGKNGGTWVHPRVAIHLSQWCSPKFAVLVTQWVLDWITEGKPPTPTLPVLKLPVYVNRLSLAAKMQLCIPDGFWTVFDKCSNLLILVEMDLRMPVDRYDLLDGSVGIHWSKHRAGKPWIGQRRTYQHIFPDRRMGCKAWAYEVKELPYFESWLKGVYVNQHLPIYLESKYRTEVPVRILLGRVLGNRGSLTTFNQ
jgi:KilA domain-containing protein